VFEKMKEESRIREMLDRKIKQRMMPNDNITDFSQNLLNELESMRESTHSEESSLKILEGEELSSQLRREGEEQHQLQMAIDRLRIRMLEVVKEEDNIKDKMGEKRK
jgi:hypothetical protein